MTARRWIRLGVVTLVLAAGLHGLIVWLIPHAITLAFVRGVSKQVGYNTVLMPPLPTHRSRSVVGPSPDLLYAVCVFDVSAGPVRISARPPRGYWSLSLYDLPAQPVDATQALNLSAGVSNCKVSRGRSFS